MSLFEDTPPPKPLAERMRPRSMGDILGQKEALKMLNALIDQGDMPSLVFSGPPGSGKTTMNRLMASLLGWEGRSLNATSASVKDIREMAKEARELWKQLERRTLLFIDEIHRLNKAQQDVLLPFLEAGTITLAGSTTENPFFALNQALRSRVQLVRLEPLSPLDIQTGLKNAAALEEIALEDDAAEWIADRVAGDLRLAYTVLESASLLARSQKKPVSVEETSLCLTQTQLPGDRKGDNHYDLASAFQKSLRGSDPNASLYYLARFLETGEDPRFIARRLLVVASEDVGNADPNALNVASNAFRAVEVMGMPECRIPLSQATLYLARAKKSNEAIKALDAFSDLIRSRPLDPIPLHLRDAHYKGAAKLGHGNGYIYTHDNPDQAQTFLPEPLVNQAFVATKPSPRKEPVDSASMEQLIQFLMNEYKDQEWFELNAETIAEKIQWPAAKVRAAINALVQGHSLTFKRMFRLPESTG